jgi:multiple sugar transport system permease protein
MLLLIAPSVVLLVLINAYPLFVAALQSVRDGSLISDGSFIGLQNYVDALTSPRFWKSAGFTLAFTLVGVFGSWAIGLGLALLLRLRTPGRNVFRVLLLLPWVVPVVVSSTSWNFLVGTPDSLAPSIARMLGLGEVYFLADPVMAAVTVCVFKVWISFPFMMLMCSSALASVDTTVYEAANMDGANRWQQFSRITLPLIARSTYISWILMAIFCVNDFPTIDRLARRPRLSHRVPGHAHRAGGRHRLPDDAGAGGRLHGPVPPDPKGRCRMSTSALARPVSPARSRASASRISVVDRENRGRWWRFAALCVISVVVLLPILATLLLSLRPAATSATTTWLTLENFVAVLSGTDVLLWLMNSLGVALATVAVSVLVAAPAGYVLSRGRGKAVTGYSLLLFVIQSLPVITAVIPLFVLFARLGLADNLLGLTIVYVASTLAVATWMMAAYFDSIPSVLEEAAWVDGCSVFGSFVRIVLRNSLPGILSTAIFAFLLAWNDYLVALVFLRSSSIFTLPIGLQTFFQQNATDWGPVMAVSVIMLLPPAIVFAVLNRYFSVGGIGGSLAGR